MKERRIFILLSSKSSGSTAMQSFLRVNYGLNIVKRTEHFEFETLYWTKAASVMGLNQLPMHRSNVPYSKEAARLSLVKFLKSNGVERDLEAPTKEDLFELFYELAAKSGYLFIEKSPHHLFNQSNVDLIVEFRDYIKSRANVILLGLVRNPLDTIYSAWSRWRFNCVAFESEWRKSYANLRSLAERGVGVKIFRYEDLVSSTAELDEYLGSCGLVRIASEFRFKNDSVGRWKSAPSFCHQLDRETILVASSFGYEQGLVNSKGRTILWNLTEYLNQLKFYLRTIRNGLKKTVSRTKVVVVEAMGSDD